MIAWFNVSDVTAHGFHHTGRFVSKHHRQRVGIRAVLEVQIGVADASRHGAYEHFPGPWIAMLNIFYLQGFVDFPQYCSFHAHSLLSVISREFAKPMSGLLLWLKPGWGVIKQGDEMILIGLGSNRGDSVQIVKEAMGRLAEFAEGRVRRSQLWRTSPVDCPPGSDDFINAAVAFRPVSGLTPEALLAALKTLESDYGRTLSPVRNAPRELDLDLLLFARQTRNETGFVLPHPRAVDRLFVLAPAAEVLPDAVWPGTGLTIRQLLDRLDSTEQVTALAVDGPDDNVPRKRGDVPRKQDDVSRKQGAVPAFQLSRES